MERYTRKSNFARAYPFIVYSNLGSHEKHILTEILSYHESGNTFYKSVHTIARNFNINRKTASHAVRRLMECGLITAIDARPGMAVRYQVNTSAVDSMEDEYLTASQPPEVAPKTDYYPTEKRTTTRPKNGPPPDQKTDPITLTDNINNKNISLADEAASAATQKNGFSLKGNAVNGTSQKPAKKTTIHRGAAASGGPDRYRHHPDIVNLCPELQESYLKYIDVFYFGKDQRYELWRQSLGHMQNLEPKEFLNLYNGLGGSRLSSYLDDMANWDGIKKKKSIFLTLKQWAGRPDQFAPKQKTNVNFFRVQNP